MFTIDNTINIATRVHTPSPQRPATARGSRTTGAIDHSVVVSMTFSFGP
jgi:hypothetical protein